ncbi:MAG TPA: hypothetical protein VD930_02410 [Gemmatimonadales bacterium]|nr:hypothetical protein [Gemmatimonadales bacterium]
MTEAAGVFVEESATPDAFERAVCAAMAESVWQDGVQVVAA